MKARLPEGECVYLRTLSGAPLKARARALYDLGWSLAAIAEAWDPPKQRSSVRSWVFANVPAPHTQPPLPSPSSLSSLSSVSSALITAAEKSNPSKPQAKEKMPRRVYDPASPRVTPAQKKKISTLAPLARRYRARTPHGGTYAMANRELTDLCKKLYYSGASVRELSLAAGVTYRAMARRLGR